MAFECPQGTEPPPAQRQRRRLERPRPGRLNLRVSLLTDGLGCSGGVVRGVEGGLVIIVEEHGDDCEFVVASAEGAGQGDETPRSTRKRPIRWYHT